MFFITLFIQPLKLKRSRPPKEEPPTLLHSEPEEPQQPRPSVVTQIKRNAEQRYFLERRLFL